MTYKSADEIKRDNITAMGKQLGEQYSSLWQEAAFVSYKWAEYVELFGTKSSRIDLLNEAAGHLFGILQQQMWDDVLMHIARLTDPPATGKRQNLTLKNLPHLVDSAKLTTKITSLLRELDKETDFCREWRNKKIAHNDLEIALEEAKLHQNGSRNNVSRSLQIIVETLNAVSEQYLNAETALDVFSPPGGAPDLLRIIFAGMKEERDRNTRIESGTATSADFEYPDV